MPLDTPGPLLDHCCLHSLGVGPRRWFRVDQGGPQWSTVVQRAPEGKNNFLTFLLMWISSSFSFPSSPFVPSSSSDSSSPLSDSPSPSSESFSPSLESRLRNGSLVCSTGWV